jgi:hypothetical protein
MSDSVCLASQEKLRLDILNLLSRIEKAFPGKTERYIEIEV